MAASASPSRDRRAQRRRGQRQRQVVRASIVADHADELAHHAEPAGPRDRPGAHRQVAGDHPQQRGLAGAVRPDQRDLGALADPERHVGEELPAVRQDVPDPCHVHVSHAGILPDRGPSRGHPDRSPACTRSTRKPFWLACRSTCQPCSVSQRCSESPPRCRADHQPGRRRPGPAGAASAAAARAARPCRSGSAGWTRSASNRTSAGTSSGARDPDPVGGADRPAFARGQLAGPRVDVDRADRRSRRHGRPARRRSARTRSRGRAGARRSRRRAASALRSSTAVPGSSRLGGEHPARRGEPVLAAGDGELDLARRARRWRARR